MELQVGVKIILQNKEGKFLFLERNPDKYPEVKKGDMLDIVGGRIKIGVPLLENLKREIFEETKLNLVAEPKLVTAQDILKTAKHVVRLTNLAETEGQPELDDEDIAYKWLTLEEAKKVAGLDPYSREVISSL